MLICFSTLTSHWHSVSFADDRLLCLPCNQAEAEGMVGAWLISDWPKVGLA